MKRLIDEESVAYSSLDAGKTGSPPEGLIYVLCESNNVGKMPRFNLTRLTNEIDWKEYVNN